MKLLLILLCCAQARAAAIPDLELLRAAAADQGVVEADIPAAPRVQAAPAAKVFEGIVRVEKKSPDWRRPKDALKDRHIDLGGRTWAWIADDAQGRALAPGTRAWIKGKFREQGSDKWRLQSRVLEVSESITFPAGKAEGLSAKAQNDSLSVELVQVSPWCDHMPTLGGAPRRQALVVETRLVNKTDEPLEISLGGAFFSFDPANEGAKVDGLSIRGQSGRPSGQTTTTLAPGAALKLELRGDNLFPEGAHGKTLFVTLQLRAGPESLFVRGSGQIVETQ